MACWIQRYWSARLLDSCGFRTELRPWTPPRAATVPAHDETGTAAPDRQGLFRLLASLVISRSLPGLLVDIAPLAAGSALPLVVVTVQRRPRGAPHAWTLSPFSAFTY